MSSDTVSALASDHVPLIDAEARRIISGDLGRTIFVEAGAGAGKTRELVERIANLVAGGVPIVRVAAITFTERAAGELRDRVRDTLEERSVDAAAGPEVAARCRAALGVLDEAPIQTLHGFAQSLLAAHAVAADLPPVFEVVDEVEAAIDFDRRWAPLLDDLFSLDEHRELMTIAMHLGLTVDRLRDLTVQFHRRWDLLAGEPPPVLPLVAPDLGALIDRADLARSARSGCDDPDDRLLGHLDGVVADFRAGLMAHPDLISAARILGDPVRLSAVGGRQERWLGPSKAEVLARLDALSAARDEARRQLAVPVLGRLCRLVQEFTLAGAAQRRASGRLEFQDLLVLARDLLRDHPGVRAAVQEQVGYLLIDEFQDTDPLQVELAVLVAGSEVDRDPPLPWREAVVGDGRLFFVGDPKQSIYRFRGADIALYQQARDAFAGDLVQLSQNFRSVDGVLGWVNHVFAALFAAPEPVVGQAPWAPLHHHRRGQAGDPPVVILGGPVAGSAQPAVRAAEAADVAEVCRLAVTEPWSIGDGTARRDAQFDDIAVLLPTRTSLPALERALDALEIPYRVESRSLMWATQEVRDLLAVLRAVDDPSDEVALVAALRSPVLACPDLALVEWRAAGGRWDPLAATPDTVSADHPVSAAMACLGTVHGRRWLEPVSVLTERVIRERGLFELAYGKRRQRESWHRLRFLLDQARAFADRGGSGLRQFLDWAERQADEGSAAVETVVPEADDRAVRILTVHAAKGLEFPIVVVAGLNTAPRRWRPAEVLWQASGPPEVSIGRKDRPWHTPGYVDHRDGEIVMEQHEALRLLYVACTRARDHLVVSLHHKAEPYGPGACLAARLWPHAEQAAHLSRRLGSPAESSPAAPAAAIDEGGVVASDAVGRLDKWRTARQQLLGRMGREPAIAATALAALAGGALPCGDDPVPADLSATGEARRRPPVTIAEDVFSIEWGRPAAAPDDADPHVFTVADPTVEESPPWKRGRAGSAFGRAVHAVLQSVDLETGDGMDALAEAQAAAEGIGGVGGAGPAVARSAWAALGSDAVRAAVAGRWWREVYVAADLGGFIVDGYIDLLYEGPTGLVVVDYKTDAVSSRALDAAAERYRIQVAAYALALEQTLGRAVAGGELVFTHGSGTRQRSVRDLEGAKLEVLALVAGLRVPPASSGKTST